MAVGAEPPIPIAAVSDPRCAPAAAIGIGGSAPTATHCNSPHRLRHDRQRLPRLLATAANESEIQRATKRILPAATLQLRWGFCRTPASEWLAGAGSATRALCYDTDKS